MGCCQNKEIYIGCACDCWGKGQYKGGIKAAFPGSEDSDQQEEIVISQPEAPVSADPFAASETFQATSASPSTAPAQPEVQPTVTSQPAPELPKESSSTQKEEKKPLPKPVLSEQLHLTGKWAQWLTNEPSARLVQDFTHDRQGTALLRLCVKLSSQSFSFQVVSPSRDWTWRLFPNDAKAHWMGHFSKEGQLLAGQRDQVPVGIGDGKKGHSLNFHVVESTDAVATIWVEVPVQSDGAQQHLQPNAEGYRVWYTLEDTGVQLTAGDGIDLNRYKYLLG